MAVTRRSMVVAMAASARALLVAAALAAGPAVAAGSTTHAAPSATAVTMARCAARHGTVVAVDFGHWGGPIVRGCGVGRRTEYALLHAVGFTTAGDDHDGPAFICRLGDAAFHAGTPYPTPREDDCVQTPSASAYWSSWLAPAGSERWTYNPLGAMAGVPRTGEVELWTFGATNLAGSSGSGVPRLRPAALRAGAGDGATASASGERIVDARPASVRTRPGSPTALIVAVVIAACLGAAALHATRRRRGREA